MNILRKNKNSGKHRHMPAFSSPHQPFVTWGSLLIEAIPYLPVNRLMLHWSWKQSVKGEAVKHRLYETHERLNIWGVTIVHVWWWLLLLAWLCLALLPCCCWIRPTETIAAMDFSSLEPFFAILMIQRLAETIMHDNAIRGLPSWCFTWIMVRGKDRHLKIPIEAWCESKRTTTSCRA